MFNLTAKATLQDGVTLSGAAHRLLTGTGTPADLTTLEVYRNSNNRETANAARLFLTLFNGCDTGDTVVQFARRRPQGSPDAWRG